MILIGVWVGFMAALGEYIFAIFYGLLGLWELIKKLKRFNALTKCKSVVSPFGLKKRLSINQYQQLRLFTHLGIKYIIWY